MTLFSTILSFILALHLLVATSGLPLAYHFCGGEIESVSLGTPKQCACDHDDAECCDKDCCQNEIAVSKLDFDGVVSSSLLVHALCAAPIAALSSFSPIAPAKILSSSRALFEQSPPHRSLDIPVLIRSLLI